MYINTGSVICTSFYADEATVFFVSPITQLTSFLTETQPHSCTQCHVDTPCGTWPTLPQRTASIILPCPLPCCFWVNFTTHSFQAGNFSFWLHGTILSTNKSPFVPLPSVIGSTHTLLRKWPAKCYRLHLTSCFVMTHTVLFLAR